MENQETLLNNILNAKHMKNQEKILNNIRNEFCFC